MTLSDVNHVNPKSERVISLAHDPSYKLTDKYNIAKHAAFVKSGTQESNQG